MTASTDLDDTLANIRARAEAATDSQWEQEWWRCHAEGYFRAAMGAVPDLVAYFTTLTPSAVLDLLTLLDQTRAELAEERLRSRAWDAADRATHESLLAQRDEIRANRDALAHKVAEQRAVIARVQMLLDDAETAGDATVEIADLDAALDGADTTTTDGDAVHEGDTHA